MDEAEVRLAESLELPTCLEKHRQAIEEALPPIQLHQPRKEREDGKSSS